MRVAVEDFQLWRLNVYPDHITMLTCEDGNGGVAFAKAIEYTDFPLAEIFHEQNHLTAERVLTTASPGGHVGRISTQTKTDKTQPYQ